MRPRVTDVAVIRLRAAQSNGFLRAEDLSVGEFASLDWPTTTPPDLRRVVVDMGRVTGFGSGVTERIAQFLLEARAGHVQVESSGRASVRARFCADLDDAVARGLVLR